MVSSPSGSSFMEGHFNWQGGVGGVIGLVPQVGVNAAVHGQWPSKAEPSARNPIGNFVELA
mgnify:CR=1 FL=1